MRASLVLADYAAQDVGAGKVHLMGAGWSIIGPAPVPQAVAAFIKLGWEEANQPHPLALRLVDADGKTVLISGPGGTEQPLEFLGTLEVSQPSNIPEGTEIDATFIINLGPLPLIPGEKFRWELLIDDKELASEPFFVRTASRSAPGPLTP